MHSEATLKLPGSRQFESRSVECELIDVQNIHFNIFMYLKTGIDLKYLSLRHGFNKICRKGQIVIFSITYSHLPIRNCL